MRFVTDKKLAEITGLGEDAIQKYRQEGKVCSPDHYFKASNKRLMWDVEAFETWLEASRYTTDESESASSGKKRESTKRPNSNPHLRV